MTAPDAEAMRKNCGGHDEHDDYTNECHAYCCPCVDDEPNATEENR